MTSDDPDADARRFAHESVAAGDPTDGSTASTLRPPMGRPSCPGTAGPGIRCSCRGRSPQTCRTAVDGAGGGEYDRAVSVGVEQVGTGLELGLWVRALAVAAVM